MTATRRLAAILAADVAGYSRLIGADEGGTLRRLKTIQTELIDPKIAAHNGRLVKTTGDGFLVEFSSVVDALRGAVEIQREMTERNAALAPNRRIEFRIGINVGDIVVEDGDIFGDGVNVAARLEGLAEPGGICVSARVQEDVVGRLDLAFEDMGDQQLRNIIRPVRVHRVLIAELAAARTSPTVSVSKTAVAPRLSIVVLPFTNLSNDPDQQYFADGITEDLTTDLSRIVGMLVISRNTAFTYQGRRVNSKQIGRELGVRYVLEGSLRRSGSQLRVGAQLIDAATDAHLWAERFDRDTGDLFALQNEITSRLANALGVELIAAEAARPTEHPDALDYILRGRAILLKPRTHREAINLFEHALALDPQSVEAQGRLAGVLVDSALNGRSDSAAVDLARAEGLVDRALAASPRYAFPHNVKGHVLRARNRWEEAIPEYETALALDHNLVSALHGLGWCKLYAGSIDEATPLVEQAIHLNPRDPLIGAFYNLIGTVHLLQSQTEEAIVWLEKARSALPDIPSFRSRLAAAYALRGETERAA
jgi:TolB-like protein/class 3 adenylate cyclase/Flp pilus assembly protein TadD